MNHIFLSMDKQGLRLSTLLAIFVITVLVTGCDSINSAASPFNPATWAAKPDAASTGPSPSHQDQNTIPASAVRASKTPEGAKVSSDQSSHLSPFKGDTSAKTTPGKAKQDKSTTKAATANLDEKRWGFWLTVLNEERIQIPVQNKDIVVPYAPLPLKRTWEAEGKVMLVEQDDGNGGVRKWTLAFDGRTKDLVEAFDGSTARLMLQPDGSFIAQEGDVRVTLRYKPEEHSIHSFVEIKPEKNWILRTHTIELSATEENKTAAQQAIAVLVQINKVNRTNDDLMARMGYQSYEQMKEANARYQQEHRERERRKEEASRRRWEMFAQGMGAIAQAAAVTSREYAAQRAQSQALNQRIDNANSLAAANERERIAANQAQLKQQQQVQQPMRSSATSPQTSSANNSARTFNMSGASSSSSQRASNLRATPEAITVCTHPSGANASFECRSPVTAHRGHKNDISGHRTPDEMVMRLDGCPSPRRLASATHLVWGCGFGATNNSNSMDRSAGVDVKGRNTYYCHEKESSCRRTSP